MKVGSDIDGVLTTGFRPVETDYVIISGRMFHEWKATVELLGVDRPIYLRPSGGDGNVYAAGQWKGMMIGMLGLEKFYEDNDIQISIIRGMCPNCKVVRIVNGEIDESF